jgi:hypothetical protein
MALFLGKEELQAIEEIIGRFKVLGARYPESILSWTAF